LANGERPYLAAADFLTEPAVARAIVESAVSRKSLSDRNPVDGPLWIVLVKHGQSLLSADAHDPPFKLRCVRDSSVAIEHPLDVGGPVFVERGDDLRFFGVYRGIIYPDYTAGTNEKVSALGVVANISIVLWGHLAMVKVPNQPHVA